MIEYRTDLDEIATDDLDGFFVGWPTHPDATTHLCMLENAYAVALAVGMSWWMTKTLGLSVGLEGAP